jgi:hypothetical protein
LRVFDLTSALSPALPLGFVLFILVLWAFCNIDRAFLLELRGPSSNQYSGIAGLPEAQGRVDRLLVDPSTRALLLAVPLLALLPFYGILTTRLDTIDGTQWGLALKFLLFAAYIVVGYAITLFLALWLRLRRLLLRVSWHPIAEAFHRLPPVLASSPWRMWRTVPSLTSYQVSVSHLRLLANLKPPSKMPPSKGDDVFWEQIRRSSAVAGRLMDQAFARVHEGFVSTLPQQERLRIVFRIATRRIVKQLEAVWAAWPRSPDSQQKLPALGSRESSMDAGTWLGRSTPTEGELWAQAAEEFVAIRLTVYIRYVFLQMKNLLTFSLAAFILALAAVSAYPFQPNRPFMAMVWVIGTLSIAAVAVVLVSIDRDRLLSYIGKTPAGEVTLNHEFITTLTLYVIVPLLTLLATQFPGIGEFIFSVFTPAMKSVH